LWASRLAVVGSAGARSPPGWPCWLGAGAGAYATGQAACPWARGSRPAQVGWGWLGRSSETAMETGWMLHWAERWVSERACLLPGPARHGSWSAWPSRLDLQAHTQSSAIRPGPSRSERTRAIVVLSSASATYCPAFHCRPKPPHYTREANRRQAVQEEGKDGHGSRRLFLLSLCQAVFSKAQTTQRDQHQDGDAQCQYDLRQGHANPHCGGDQDGGGRGEPFHLTAGSAADDGQTDG
jgi:hypothetical protein